MPDSLPDPLHTMPFRKALWRALILAAVLSTLLPSALVLKRSWDHLYELIDRSFLLLSSAALMVSAEELKVMNAFSLNHLSQNLAENGPESGAAFNMVLMENRIFSKEELHREAPALDAEKMQERGQYWMAELTADPKTMAVFQRAKHRLVDLVRQARAAGFSLAQLYIMVDQGRQSTPFFQDRMAFVLESLDWRSGSETFAGQEYRVSSSEQTHWRDTYLHESGGGPGFYHNPVFDPIFPRFDDDAWGSWFTSWHAIPAVDNGTFNTFNIDFDATRVKILMLQTVVTLLILIVSVGMVIYFLIRSLVRAITDPVDALTHGAMAVQSDRFDHVVPNLGSSEFLRLIDVFNSMIRGLKERFHLKHAFSSMVSEELADMAARGEVKLGGEEKVCTMLFTDFVGFSTVIQGMAAESVVAILNKYFSALIPIIQKYNGMPDKYIGDAIVAIFGAPGQHPDHAYKAVCCAIEMQKTMRKINELRLSRNEIVFEMRVGLNTGPVVVGAIGCAQKMEYTTIGEATNLANRMESVCKIGHVLMAEETYFGVRDYTFDNVVIDVTPHEAQVKGYKKQVKTYGIYVHDLAILKNEHPEDGQGFYLYKQIKRTQELR